MRLFVLCNHCNQKIYFNSTAQSRNQLPSVFQLKCSNLSCGHVDVYYSRNVTAEPTITATSGAFLGGILGLLLGPEGAVGGALLGAAYGKKKQDEEQATVDRFNSGWD